MPDKLKPNSSYVSDQRFFAQLAATQSLPDTNPTDAATSQPATQEPTNQPGQVQSPERINPLAAPFPADELTAPPTEDQTVTEDPTQQPPPAVVADDFSTDLLGAPASTDDPTQTQTQVPTTVPEAFAEFVPSAESPEWQREAFNNIVTDASLSDQDKKDILSQTPYSWTKQRKWRRDSKILGKFRDGNVPAKDVLTALGEQNPTRLAQLETAAVAGILEDSDRIVQFAEGNPQLYSDLIVALVAEAPEYVERVLNSRGYVVQKATPQSADDILERLQSSPYYDAIKGSEFADELVETITKLAQSAQPAASSVDTEGDKDTQTGQQPFGTTQEFFQKVAPVVDETQRNVFDRAVADGLRMEGIRPATEAELAKNPLAHLKNVLFAIGVHGLEGVVHPVDKQMPLFMKGNADYSEGMAALDAALAQGDLNRFKAEASALAPFYQQLGTARAGIPFIKNMYRQIAALLGETDTVPDPTVPTVEDRTAPDTLNTTGATSRLEERLAKSGFASDRLLLAKLRGQ